MLIEPVGQLGNRRQDGVRTGRLQDRGSSINRLLLRVGSQLAPFFLAPAPFAAGAGTAAAPATAAAAIVGAATTRG